MDSIKPTSPTNMTDEEKKEQEKKQAETDRK